MIVIMERTNYLKPNTLHILFIKKNKKIPYIYCLCLASYTAYSLESAQNLEIPYKKNSPCDVILSI